MVMVNALPPPPPISGEENLQNLLANQPTMIKMTLEDKYRGGGTNSNLGGGPLLDFHLQCSLGGASRHLARSRSQVHFGLSI